MEQVTHSAPPQGGSSTWIDRLEGSWRDEFADERQEAIWNKASASALTLVGWVGVLAALVFVTVDAARYSPCALALGLVACAGPMFTQAIARRQDVRPVSRVPSWPAMAVNALLTGLTFYVLIRAMEPEQGWRAAAVSAVAFAALWALGLRSVLRKRQKTAVGRGRQVSGGR
jgi:FtsH-binding integral membrane protein